MLDFSWTELLVLVAVIVLVVRPEDIPRVMYGVGRVVRRLQYVRFAISKQFEEILHDGDIEELRRGVNFEHRGREIDGDNVVNNDVGNDGEKQDTF